MNIHVYARQVGCPSSSSAPTAEPTLPAKSESGVGTNSSVKRELTNTDASVCKRPCDDDTKSDASGSNCANTFSHGLKRVSVPNDGTAVNPKAEVTTDVKNESKETVKKHDSNEDAADIDPDLLVPDAPISSYAFKEQLPSGSKNVQFTRVRTTSIKHLSECSQVHCLENQKNPTISALVTRVNKYEVWVKSSPNVMFQVAHVVASTSRSWID